MRLDYEHYKTISSNYKTTLNTYNEEKELYNFALKQEKQRRANAFRLAWTQPITIPPRPCKPAQPIAYDGVDFQRDPGTFANWSSERGAKKGTLAENTSIMSALGSFKQGYLQVSTDSSQSVQTTSTRQNVFHTYGLLGQGPPQSPSATVPAKAFQWK